MKQRAVTLFLIIRENDELTKPQKVMFDLRSAKKEAARLKKINGCDYFISKVRRVHSTVFDGAENV